MEINEGRLSQAIHVLRTLKKKKKKTHKKTKQPNKQEIKKKKGKHLGGLTLVLEDILITLRVLYLETQNADALF